MLIRSGLNNSCLGEVTAGDKLKQSVPQLYIENGNHH
jgi:hypothetical protein